MEERAGERRCPALCRHVPGRVRETIPAPVDAKVGLRFMAEDREERALLSPTLSSLAGKRVRKPRFILVSSLNSMAVHPDPLPQGGEGIQGSLYATLCLGKAQGGGPKPESW